MNNFDINFIRILYLKINKIGRIKDRSSFVVKSVKILICKLQYTILKCEVLCLTSHWEKVFDTGFN